MTQQQRQQIREARDTKAREQQSWWDEFEAFIARPSDPAHEQLDEVHSCNGIAINLDLQRSAA